MTGLLSRMHLLPSKPTKSDYYDAIKYFEQELPKVQEKDDEKQERNICIQLAHIYGILGQHDQSAKFSKKVLDISTRRGDFTETAIHYFAVGNALASTCDYPNAIECYKTAIDHFKQLGDEENLKWCYTNLSLIESQGKPQEATYFEEEGFADKIDDKEMQNFSFANLAKMNLLLSHLEKAVESYQQKAAFVKQLYASEYREILFPQLGDNERFHFIDGFEMIDMNKLGCAMQRSNDSLYIAKEREESKVYFKSAVSQVQTGQLTKAIEMAQKSLEISVSIDDKAHLLSICTFLGHLIYFAGRYDKESGKFDDYMSVSRQYMQVALDCHDHVFTHLRHNDQIKISIFDEFVGAYKCLTTILIETKQSQQALLVSDRGRARALSDCLSFAYGMSQEEYLSSKPLTYADVESVVSNDAFTILILHCSLLYDSLAMWLITKDSMTLKVCDKEPFVSADESVSGGNTKKDQEDTLYRLFDDTVSKVYRDMKVQEEVTCENRSADDSMTSLNPNNETDCSLRDGSGGEKEEPDLHELFFNTFIAPVLADIHHHEIVIVPDGEMYIVPFAALKDPKTGKYLSESKRIRLAPSIAVLKLLQESPVDQQNKQGALIVGNPSVGKVKFRGKEKLFQPLLGALKEARVIVEIIQEASEIRKLSPNITLLTETGATKDVMLSKIKEQTGIIHIAAHGSTTHGEIVLAPITSQDGQGLPEEEDYLLTMKEVQEVGVKAQLVVLSCCHSGRGEIRAEGMVGMSRAFLAAGARAVVASLWAISDTATYNFMVRFYESLCRGKSASVSLHNAVAFLRGHFLYSDPKYWAPFFIIGDDVTIRFGQ